MEASVTNDVIQLFLETLAADQDTDVKRKTVLENLQPISERAYPENLSTARQ